MHAGSIDNPDTVQSMDWADNRGQQALPVNNHGDTERTKESAPEPYDDSDIPF